LCPPQKADKTHTDTRVVTHTTFVHMLLLAAVAQAMVGAAAPRGAAPRRSHCLCRATGLGESAQRHTVQVHSEAWLEPPGGGRRARFLRATISGGTEIGQCGLEVIPMHADGLMSNDENAPGMRPRAVLSGKLWVELPFRRQGVAQRLLREAETHARLMGCDSLLLMVKHYNKPAMSLYEKMGYVKHARLQEHGEQIGMSRNLFWPNLHNLHSIAPKHNVVQRTGRGTR